MKLWEALLMGLIQGLTEFLPVSSSGHLAIFQNIFKLNTQTGLLFDVMLHVGTLAAVIIVFWRDIYKLVIEGIGILADVCRNSYRFFKNLFSKGEKVKYRKVVRSSYRKFVMLVIVSTIPTGIIGFMAKDLVELAGTTLIVPGICLLITAVLLLIADDAKEGEKRPKTATYSNAFAIGIVQGIATFPGISRSGATITACLFSGFEKKFAVKYSFIMSIPAIIGAAILELKDIGSEEIAKGEWIN